MYALKIKFGKVTRRVATDESSFENLKQTLKRLFNTELTTDSFVVKYKDDENDLITVRFGFLINTANPKIHSFILNLIYP